MNEVKREYMRVDMLRMVKERGAKLVWPENHRRRSVLALRVLLYLTSEESPLKGSSEWQKVSMWKMVTALYEGYWQKSLDISSADSLAHILTSLGYSNPLALISAANESEVIKEALTSRTQAGVEKGLFGVPSFFIATQPDRLIYGQDNLEQLEELLGGASHLQKIIDTFDLKRFQAPSLPPSPTSTSITPLFPSLPLYATTFYMDYSSPYTYLAWLRIQSLFGPSNIHCEPVLLGALFKGVGQHNTPMATMSPARQAWSSQELLFQLSTLNAPFQWASRFPLRTILPLRMTIAAGPNTAEGRKLVSAFFHAFWALDQDPTDSSVCINIATQCGLDGQAIYTKANLPETKKALQTQTDVALQHGVFGLPMVRIPRWASAQEDYNCTPKAIVTKLVFFFIFLLVETFNSRNNVFTNM